MQYTMDEALRETLRRAAVLRRQRERRTKSALLGGTAAVALSLIAFALRLVPHGAALNETAYGAFLLSGEAGGYIFAGVAAFVLGVLVTLLCVYSRQRSERSQHPPNRGAPDTAEEKNGNETISYTEKQEEGENT